MWPTANAARIETAHFLLRTMISYEITAFNEPLVRAERPAPTPTGTEVLVSVLAAGVCHTDVHTRSGYYDLGGGNTLRMNERGIRLPLTLGHEIAGEAVQGGEQVAASVLGKRYLVYPWIGCGVCEVCQAGQENMCAAPRSLGFFRAGGYSDHVLVPDSRYLIPIPDMAPEVAAPLACSGLTTYSALKKIDPQTLARTPVVVIGAGGLGLMCIKLIEALGGKGALVLDINQARLAAAAEAGALAVFDTSGPAVVDAIRATAGGAILSVIDFVGSVQTVELGMSLLSKGGKIQIVGLAGGEMRLPLPMLPLRAMSIEGRYVGSLQELRELVELARAVGLTPVPTVCRRLHEAEASLNDLEAGKITGRIVLKP
jgi:propanol-preferring alcohol dehydrogenase